jgi:hypothetical protein
MITEDHNNKQRTPWPKDKLGIRQRVIDMLDKRAKTPKKVSRHAEVCWYTGRQVFLNLGLTEGSWEQHARELGAIISILDQKKLFPEDIPVDRKIDWIETTLCIEFAPVFHYPDDLPCKVCEKELVDRMPDLMSFMRKDPVGKALKERTGVVGTSYRDYVNRILTEIDYKTGQPVIHKDIRK